ncbi:MAG: hypothetical protein ACLGPL_05400 [Acidobacteriota bacterium]
MSHGHDDHHHHSHAHGTLTESERFIRMVEHWIHHNIEHAESYRDWADKARGMGREEVYLILEDVARGTRLLNDNLEKILTLLKNES